MAMRLWTLVPMKLRHGRDQRRRNLFPAKALHARVELGIMDKSIHQARWVLGPLFGLCFSVALVGLFFG